MARIRGDGTILLNGLQMATFEELKSKMVDGIITGDVAAGYKQNVIRSLVKHGVIKPVRKGSKHYKLVDGAVIEESLPVQHRPGHPDYEAPTEALAA